MVRIVVALFAAGSVVWLSCIALIQELQKLEVFEGRRYSDSSFASTCMLVANLGVCVLSCLKVDACLSVNYQFSTRTCEHNTLLPDLFEPNFEAGWKMIFRIPETVSVTGVTAWQTSSYAWYTADRAIDGNLNSNMWNGYCSHTFTLFSFWAVELPNVTSIDSITVYHRTDCCVDRFMNLRFTAYLSRQDFDRSTGSECGFYAGPPTGKPPVNITCTPGTSGKVLKIQQEAPGYGLELCEVIINSS